MYSGETTQVSDVDRITGIGREFARMSGHERDELLDRLVRIRQADQALPSVGKIAEAGYGVQGMAEEGDGPRRSRGITLENVERVFTYQAWDPGQISKAEPVREAILFLARAILRNVRDCPDRSVALRKLRELRMDVNAAITHRGEF